MTVNHDTALSHTSPVYNVSVHTQRHTSRGLTHEDMAATSVKTVSTDGLCEGLSQRLSAFFPASVLTLRESALGLS